MTESQKGESGKLPAQLRSRLSETAWKELYESLAVKLGESNLYWQVCHSTKDNEAIHGALADDFADIYRDRKEGLSRIHADRVLPESTFGTGALITTRMGANMQPPKFGQSISC